LHQCLSTRFCCYSAHRHATFQLARFAAAALHADSDEAVAKEVVALLRQRGSYSPPSDGRLLRALQHQLDSLGLPGPQAVAGQEVLLVPSYLLDDVMLGEQDTCDDLRLSTKNKTESSRHAVQPATMRVTAAVSAVYAAEQRLPS
jgi:hypothetical protein